MCGQKNSRLTLDVIVVRVVDFADNTDVFSERTTSFFRVTLVLDDNDVDVLLKIEILRASGDVFLDVTDVFRVSTRACRVSFSFCRSKGVG